MAYTDRAPRHGSSFTWHQPCNKQRTLSVHHFTQKYYYTTTTTTTNNNNKNKKEKNKNKNKNKKANNNKNNPLILMGRCKTWEFFEVCHIFQSDITTVKR